MGVGHRCSSQRILSLYKPNPDGLGQTRLTSLSGICDKRPVLMLNLTFMVLINYLFQSLAKKSKSFVSEHQRGRCSQPLWDKEREAPKARKARHTKVLAWHSFNHQNFGVSNRKVRVQIDWRKACSFDSILWKLDCSELWKPVVTPLGVCMQLKLQDSETFRGQLHILLKVAPMNDNYCNQCNTLWL